MKHSMAVPKTVRVKALVLRALHVGRMAHKSVGFNKDVISSISSSGRMMNSLPVLGAVLSFCSYVIKYLYHRDKVDMLLSWRST